MISIGRQVDVKNGDGKFIMRASDKLISFKDTMSFMDGRSQTVYNAVGNSSFRMMFEFASSSTSWSILTPNGTEICAFEDYTARMEEFKDVHVESSIPVMQSDGRADLGGVLGNVAANMLNNKISSVLPGRLVYRIMEGYEKRNVIGWVVPSRGTGWFDFLPYTTRNQILSFPFASRAYTPSYEFKIGNLYGPTVLKLQKQRDLLVDRYTLEKFGDITDQQERWAIPVLTLVTMLERTRIKQMTDN